MEQKKSKAPIILSIFLVIAIIAICVMAYFIYTLSSDKKSAEDEAKKLNQEILNLENMTNDLQEQINSTSNTVSTSTNETITLKAGTYVVQGINVTPDENYGIESITLSADGSFSANLPLGTSYIGTYTFENNTLICTATQETNLEGGGSSNTSANLTFEFTIVDSEDLRFSRTSSSDLNTTVGMIYKFEDEENESSSSNTSSNVVDISGSWIFEKGLLNGQEVDSRDIFGSSIENGIGSLTLNQDGSFSDLIGTVTSSEFDNQTSGTYTVNGSTINLVYSNNQTKTLTYNSSENCIEYPAGGYTYILKK